MCSVFFEDVRQGKGVESLECAFLIVREFTCLHNDLSCKSVGRSAILVRRLQGFQVLSQSFDSRFQETVVSELIFLSCEFGDSSVLQEVKEPLCQLRQVAWMCHVICFSLVWSLRKLPTIMLACKHVQFVFF